MSKESEFDKRNITRQKTWPGSVYFWPPFGENKEFDLEIEKIMEQLRHKLEEK
jgi:hypothetical protein